MEMNKDKLTVMYEELLKFADYRDQQPIKYFVHCTSKTKRENIMREGTLYGSYSEYPAGSILSKNENHKGVWFMISLYDGSLMDHSPYGTQRVRIPIGKLMFHMKGCEEVVNGRATETEDVALETDIQSASRYCETEEAEGLEEQEIGETEELDINDPEAQSEACPVPNDQGGHKKQKSKSRDKKRDRKKRAEERKRETTPTVAIKQEPVIPQKRRFAFLFFENAYHYAGGSQYVRLVLIKVNNPFVQFCREHMLEINLFDNPFFNWNGWKLKSIENDKTSNWRILVEVFVIGDVSLDGLKIKSNWDDCGTHTRAGCPPCIGVFHPLKMK